MPNWKKVIVSGSNAVLNNITASGHMSVLDGGLTANTHTSTELEVVGNISASIISASTFVGDGSQLTGISVDASSIDHNSLNNFVGNEHINHSDVSIIAGDGLTGGGNITTSKTLNVVGGTGVSVGADSISIGQDVGTSANVTFDSIVVDHRKLGLSVEVDFGFRGDIVGFGDPGSNFTQGLVHHYDGANWDRASTEILASATSLLAIAVGSDPSDGMLIRGFFTLNFDPGTATEPLYLGTNGTYSTSPPSTNGHYSKVLGSILQSTTNRIWFNPSSDWIEIEA